MSDRINYFVQTPIAYRRYSGHHPSEFAVWAAGRTTVPGELPNGYHEVKREDGKYDLQAHGMFGDIVLQPGDWCVKFETGNLRMSDTQFKNTYPSLWTPE